MHILAHLIRLVVAAIVLMIVSWIVPGFSIGSFGSAFLFAVVIALVGWLVESLFGKRISPFGRGIVGFLVSALVIYFAQFVVGGVRASLIGAILAALVIGIIDLFVPVATPFKRGEKQQS
ncbi:membrane protein [Paenibacillus sp. J31TS4]|uniref:phage holin family protein n=1 Tax=Paenibacillus sp. J31TS4 TaxID=2807195 RepID=UPI001B2CB7C9|nr:phage holin family protein [Paenibacillus sp. J31TS4]GIP38800.1 membrane protein [Paenibacillus sp. J31TS4]